MVKTRLASVAELEQRGTIKFNYRDEGIQREGFLAWVGGGITCYENVCRHVPISLDYGDGEFFTPDKQHFICRTHGATYLAATGECVAGPCAGAYLKRLEIAVESGEVFLVQRND